MMSFIKPEIKIDESFYKVEEIRQLTDRNIFAEITQGALCF